MGWGEGWQEEVDMNKTLVSSTDIYQSLALMLLLLLPLLLCIGLSKSLHNHHLTDPSSHSHSPPSHSAYFNRPCCQQFGGTECGHIWKTCCVGQCKQALMVEYCDGQSINLPPNICHNSCVSQCESKGGFICGASWVQDSCCAPQYCTGISAITRSCQPGSKIPLVNCAPSTIV